MKKYIWIAIAMIGLCSCSEDEIKSYSAENYLYFSQLMNSKSEYMEMSFNNYPLADELTVKIGVSLVGKPVSTPTPYKVMVVDKETTADAKNYKLPETAYFGPGLASDTLEVKLIKTDDLTENVKLCLQLVPNEYFNVGMTQYEQITVMFNNVISKPVWWTKDIVNFYLGDYSRTKYEALVRYTTDGSRFGELGTGEKRKCALELKAAIEKYSLMDKDDDGNEFPMEVPIY